MSRRASKKNDRGYADIPEKSGGTKASELQDDRKENPESKNEKAMKKQDDRFSNKGITKNMFYSKQEDSLDYFNVQVKRQHKDESTHQNFEESDVSPRDEVKNASHVVLSPYSAATENQSEKVFDEGSFYNHSLIVPKQKIQALQKEKPKIQKQKKEVAQSSIQSNIQSKNKTPMTIQDLQRAHGQDFIRMNIPQHKKMATILKRNRTGTEWFYPRYQMFFKDDMEFIMMSKRKPLNIGSKYIMSSQQVETSEEQNEYAGTVKANFTGSRWNFYDELPDGNQKMIATFLYNPRESCCSQNPRAIEIYVISPYYEYEDLEGADRGLTFDELAGIGSNLENKRIFKIVNKKPIWNPYLERYELDFHGKAQLSSVKNSILVNELDRSQEIMLMTKCADETYLMQIQFPLSPRLAMAIATSSFDYKLASQ